MFDHENIARPGSSNAKRPVFLHVFHSLGCGGAQTRFVHLANYFRARLRFVVIALDGDYSSLGQIGPDADIVVHPWRNEGGPLPRQLQRIGSALGVIRPDCLVTHNWGTIDWVIASWAHRLRHIHIEDGFGPDESRRLKLRRVLARRVLLSRSDVVVPSLTLKRIAEKRWKIGADRLHFIPNGIDCARYAANPASAARLRSVDFPWTIGTVAGLRPEKNLARLFRAFALVRRNRSCRLTIVGDGPERAALEALAAQLNIRDNVTFTGHIDDPAPLYRTFDVFALTSDTEQMPYTVIEAMAAGLPIVSTRVGDIGSMVSPDNEALIVDCDDTKVAQAIMTAIDDRVLALSVGAANQRVARLRFERQTMFDAFDRLYGVATATESLAG